MILAVVELGAGPFFSDALLQLCVLGLQYASNLDCCPRRDLAKPAGDINLNLLLVDRVPEECKLGQKHRLPLKRLLQVDLAVGRHFLCQNFGLLKLKKITLNHHLVMPQTNHKVPLTFEHVNISFCHLFIPSGRIFVELPLAVHLALYPRLSKFETSRLRQRYLQSCDGVGEVRVGFDDSLLKFQA